MLECCILTKFSNQIMSDMVDDCYKMSQQECIVSLEEMLLIRRFEERCSQLYGNGLIGGFCHLYIGQEAVVVATKLAMRDGDCTITSYRDHGHALMFGIKPENVFAELLGRIDGCSKGKGGSMHMFSKEKKFFGGHGIVGAQVSLGTGLAFAEKYNSTGNISYTFLGDGAANQGQIFESFNMAALWGLPVVYVIENNEYGMGTSVSRSCYETNLYKRGESLGIEGIQIDGMRIDELFSKFKQISNYVRSNNKPFIIEVKTYRYRGHSMSDPAKYRTKEEVEKYKNTDPIEYLKDIMLKNNYISSEEIDAIDSKIKNEIRAAAEFAQNSSLPDESELYTDIYK